jgi:hypothetical protein
LEFAIVLLNFSNTSSIILLQYPKTCIMQSAITTNDITSINIELNELRSKFDQAMREGSAFQDLREIYLHMKELECHLNALQWDPERSFAMHHNASAHTWAR